jgi:deoxyribonuclease-4
MKKKYDLLLGAHMSIAGGLQLAVEKGAELGCTALQIFTKNASQWRERDLSVGEISRFKEAVERHPIGPVVAHGGYLINPASPDEGLWERSVRALVRELERCSLLGLPMLVIHPGSHRGSGEERGLERVASALKRVLDESDSERVRIVLENTAGQGDALGWRFDHLKYLLDAVGSGRRLGVCFDTAHAFAAGYDLRTLRAYEGTMRELDGSVGLGRVMAVHLNDAKKPLGSRVDRHEHIGRGCIGSRGFGLIMRDETLAGVPKILETPKYRGEEFMDPVNLKILRRLARRKVSGSGPSAGADLPG